MMVEERERERERRMVVDDAYNLDNLIFAVFITFVDLVRWRKSKSVGREESANKQNCFGKTRNE